MKTHPAVESTLHDMFELMGHAVPALEREETGLLNVAILVEGRPVQIYNFAQHADHVHIGVDIGVLASDREEVVLAELAAEQSVLSEGPDRLAICACPLTGTLTLRAIFPLDEVGAADLALSIRVLCTLAQEFEQAERAAPPPSIH